MHGRLVASSSIAGAGWAHLNSTLGDNIKNTSIQCNFVTCNHGKDSLLMSIFAVVMILLAHMA